MRSIDVARKTDDLSAILHHILAERDDQLSRPNQGWIRRVNLSRHDDTLGKRQSRNARDVGQENLIHLRDDVRSGREGDERGIAESQVASGVNWTRQGRSTLRRIQNGHDYAAWWIGWNDSVGAVKLPRNTRNGRIEELKLTVCGNSRIENIPVKQIKG